jgi:Tol biopolymer transport system component
MMFFSPDGESLGFFQDGKLKRISLAGGSPITLCDAPPSAQTGDWFGNTIVFTASIESGQGLYRVSANGGEPEMLATVNPDEENAYLFPQLLPDEETLLFTIAGGVAYRTALLSLETGERKVVLENARQTRYLATGHLVYEQSETGNLMVVPFDLDALEIAGDSVPVVQQVRQDAPGYVDYAVSDNGTLVYVPWGDQRVHEHSLVWVDREGRETLVTEENQPFAIFRISPNGKKVALSVGDDGGYISLYDFEADSFSRLTLADERSGSPVWSPDGSSLIFQSGQAGSESGMVRQPFDGSRPQERLTSTTARNMPSSWSPDGQYLIFTSNSRPGTFDVGLLPLEGNGEPQWIISSGAAECCAQLSPDGKWLAYVSNELGRMNVYVTPFPEADVKWLISEAEDGGEQPVWSLPDGNELFYRSGNRMMVSPIQTGERTLTRGTPEVLFEGSYVSTHSLSSGVQYYDISPDGQRFLMMKEGELPADQSQIYVILNWFEELKRLVPTDN